MDELADEVFKILMVDKRKMGFLPSSVDEDPAVDFAEANGRGLSQPEETEAANENEIAERHLDDKLQTNLKDGSAEETLKTILRGTHDRRRTRGEYSLSCHWFFAMVRVQ